MQFFLSYYVKRGGVTVEKKKIEDYPVNLATAARMFDILPGTLYHWYRDHISDYLPDRSSGKWPSKNLTDIDCDTGEILKEQPVYVMKPENVGDKMCIYDNAIGHDGFTILSNAQTGKISMVIESCRDKELADAISFFGDALLKVKTVSCDMSPTYLKLCREQMPHAQTVVDKFHVMSYLYDAVFGHVLSPLNLLFLRFHNLNSKQV